MERVADYIIRKVYESGVRHIFMLTGRGILYLTDAVARSGEIEPVCTYHEQGASFAAMAYAKAGDTPAACLVSTGCAATNAVTACLCAYQDNIPIVFISGNNPLEENTGHTGVNIRTYGSQEADIISMVRGITKYAVMLEDKDEIAYEVEKALFLASDRRKGPVWIDVPLDVQNMRIDDEKQKHFAPLEDHKEEKISEEDIDAVAAEIQDASRPIILIGGGARESRDEIEAIADKYGFPIVFSPSACDVYGTSHVLSIGCVGSIGGSRAGNFAVQNADYVLAIGTKLCSQETGKKAYFARNAKNTVVDIDVNEHKKDGVHIDRLIVSDAKMFLSELLKKLTKGADPVWSEKCKHWKGLFSIDNESFVKELKKYNALDLYSFADIMSEHLSDDATVITDAGFEELIIPSTIRYGKDQKCLFPASQGAMGYAIPAIIGAYKVGRKNIACIVGDGSIMMNIQELQMIQSLQIPAKIFVINNNMYSVIRKRQKDLFRDRTVGNDPSDGVPEPDFERLSDGFGIAYRLINDREELKKEISGILSDNTLEIIEVMSTPDQKYLHESYAINEKKRLVRRPIEDMSPFLDREVLRQEMIIPVLED